jgi:hypothetical protein
MGSRCCSSPSPARLGSRWSLACGCHEQEWPGRNNCKPRRLAPRTGRCCSLLRALLRVEKFPALMRREFACKRLNLLALDQRKRAVPTGCTFDTALALLLKGDWPHGAWVVVLLLALNYGAKRPGDEALVLGAGVDGLYAGLGGLCVLACAAAVSGRPRFLPRYALYAFYPRTPPGTSTLAGLGLTPLLAGPASPSVRCVVQVRYSGCPGACSQACFDGAVVGWFRLRRLPCWFSAG